VLRDVPPAVPALCCLVAAAFGLGGALLALAVPAAGGAALAAAGALSLLPAVPRIAYRMAALPVPVVPVDAADLRSMDDPPEAAGTVRRALAADGYVTAAATGSALATAAAQGWVLSAGGWAPPVFAGLCGAVLLLRARMFGGVAQRLWLVGAGLAAAVSLAAAVAARHGGQAPMVLAAALVVAGGVTAGAAARRRRIAPTWGRAADVAEGVGAVLLLALALQVAGVFGALRGWAG
jgi:type VII secretion integral membrane protein EccD